MIILITFMYISVLLLIPIIFLYSYQFNKLDNKKVSYKYKYIKLCKFMLVDILLGCIVIFLIIFVFPSLTWLLNEKVYQPESEVLNTSIIKPLSHSNDKIYVREILDNNGGIYIINVNNSLQQYDSKSIELVENNLYNGDAKLIEENEYNVYELKGYGLITSSVNDMYANIYLHNPKKTFLKKKTQICVPKNSIEKTN
ncbi:hypothetical protein OSC52_20005 [Clostridium pasteurianum]|uniref:hypothetical protein n=1 Tax=Clostridium pasteurianum TaxID=1501 RepID=UPI002260E5F7|nr:hypothetical protein [Clostridium pasteurianum]UZW16352.1 hypothetical protein OSC52_20005 [Clostridium pasteurianum]